MHLRWFKVMQVLVGTMPVKTGSVGYGLLAVL